MQRTEWFRFSDKVRLALENSRQADPKSGTSGLEIEFNILDAGLNPVEHVGYGPEGQVLRRFPVRRAAAGVGEGVLPA